MHPQIPVGAASCVAVACLISWSHLEASHASLDEDLELRNNTWQSKGHPVVCLATCALTQIMICTLLRKHMVLFVRWDARAGCRLQTTDNSTANQSEVMLRSDAARVMQSDAE